MIEVGRWIMGMPVTIGLADESAGDDDARGVFDLFREVDDQFSPYKPTSDVSRFNRGELPAAQPDAVWRVVMAEAQRTKRQTAGYFEVWRDGRMDPSGVVKGWAIQRAVELLQSRGHTNFYVSAGGDVATRGLSSGGRPWSVGIRDPLHPRQFFCRLHLTDAAIATSGTYLRGNHIYNPIQAGAPSTEIVSLSVIAPNIFDADRFATAALAMGRSGLEFIEALPGCEGLMIDRTGQGRMTTGFQRFVRP